MPDGEHAFMSVTYQQGELQLILQTLNLIRVATRDHTCRCLPKEVHYSRMKIYLNCSETKACILTQNTWTVT